MDVNSESHHDEPERQPRSAHTVAERLARACRALGLSATVLSPTRIKASVPHAHHHLAEVIKIMPDEDENLFALLELGRTHLPRQQDR